MDKYRQRALRLARTFAETVDNYEPMVAMITREIERALIVVRNETLEEAAKEIDCGGKESLCKPQLWANECIRRTSSECFHDLANEIRALKIKEEP